jgi:hypothetical protein
MKTMTVKKPWQCRHDIDYVAQGDDACGECVLMPEPIPELVLETLALNLRLHIESIIEIIDSSTVSRELLIVLVEKAQLAVMLASARATSLDAPSCQVEFPLRYAMGGLSNKLAVNDGRAIEVGVRHLRAALKSATKWDNDVREWAKARAGTEN